jgi:hypothetical protein
MPTTRERCPGERFADEVVFNLCKTVLSTPLSILACSLWQSRELIFGESWLRPALGFPPPFLREMCVLSAAIVVIAGLLFGLLVIWMFYRAIHLIFYSKKGGYETDKRLWSLQ